MGDAVEDCREVCKEGQEEQQVDSSFTCEICIEPVYSNQIFKNRNNKCSHHSYCSGCIAKYIEVKIQEYNMAEIKCAGLDCEELLEPLQCCSILPQRLFIRWCDVLCESTVSKYERVHCPFQDCSTLILNECGEKVMKTKCPNCKKLLCFECKIPWHVGYKCEETGQLRDMNDILLGELMERKKWKRCPVCSHGVQLRSGCTIVKCRCGRSFCYTCGRSQCHCKMTNLDFFIVSCITFGPFCICVFTILIILGIHPGTQRIK